MRASLNAVLCASVLALALASCESDSTPTQHHWSPNAVSRTDWRSPVAMLLKYDANHDGALTRKELETGLKADFDAADVKHAGCLDSDEVTAINEERMKYDESAASPLIDFQNRGCVNFDEYATMARSLFEQLDVDGNGVLEPNEMRPHKVRKPVVTPTQVTSPGGGY